MFLRLSTTLFLLILAFCSPICSAAAGSPIAAGAWEIMAAGGAIASYGIEADGRVRVEVKNPGTELWHAQIRHGFPVERGHRYRFTANLSGVDPQGLPVWIQQNAEPYEILSQATADIRGDSTDGADGVKPATRFEFVAPEDDSVYVLFALGRDAHPAFTIESASVKDLGLIEGFDWERADLRPGSPDYAPRVNFGRRLEPEDGVLHGAGQDDVAFKEYVTALGEADLQPRIFMDYAGLYEDWAPRIEDWSRTFRASDKLTSSPLTLQLGLYLVDGALARFNADETNAELDRIATSLEALNAPVFLRIGYEPNGFWNNYPPEEYIKAFRRISTYLRNRIPNLAVVWCIVARQGGMDAAMKWYPGDEYVDWWGIDLFSPSDLFHPETHDFLIESERRKFPVMIGEATPRFVGVAPADKAWRRWFEPFFALIRQQPAIKAFCYINWDWPVWSEKLDQDWANWGDARIQTSPDLLPLLRAELSLPLYKNATPAPATPTDDN